MSDMDRTKDLFYHLEKQGVKLPERVIGIDLETRLDEADLITFTCHATPEVMKAMYLYACECEK